MKVSSRETRSHMRAVTVEAREGTERAPAISVQVSRYSADARVPGRVELNITPSYSGFSREEWALVVEAAEKALAEYDARFGKNSDSQ